MNKKHFFGIALVLFFSIIVLLLFFSVFFSFRNSKLKGISNDFFRNFRFKSEKSYDSETLTGTFNDYFLKIKILSNISNETAMNYINDRIFVINSLYREVHSPYPGRLSNTIACDDEFKPVRLNSSYLIYATERYTYGACSWDLIKYKTVLHYVYCINLNSLYQIEFFVPYREYDEIYEKIISSSVCLEDTK